MKRTISKIVFVPVAVSIISAALMILSNIEQNSALTWVMWEVTLFSTIITLFVFSALCTFGFIERLIHRFNKATEQEKETGDVYLAKRNNRSEEAKTNWAQAA